MCELTRSRVVRTAGLARAGGARPAPWIITGGPGPGSSRARTADEGDAILAYEPGLFAAERMVLRTDGRIVTMSGDAIRRGLDAEARP